jgi:hypothetical protein
MRSWFDRLADSGRIKHGLADALYSAMRETLADKGYSLIVDAIGLLLPDAGKGDGVLRPEIEAEEMLMLSASVLPSVKVMIALIWVKRALNGASEHTAPSVVARRVAGQHAKPCDPGGLRGLAEANAVVANVVRLWRSGRRLLTLPALPLLWV